MFTFLPQYANQQPRTQQAGFSLIEVLVALALFAIVVTMSVGTMIIMIDANSKAQFTQSIVSNVSFALDSMTRDIRTGTNYVCLTGGPAITAADSAWDSWLRMDDSPGAGDDATPRNCTGGGHSFAFTESGGSLTDGLANNRIGFRLNTATGQIERKLSYNAGTWLPITAENVNITELRFVVRNTSVSLSDNYSPTVVIYIRGEGVGDFQDTEFDLQTTVTQRALDI